MNRFLVTALLSGALVWAQTSTDVVASGLQGPNRVRITPRGNLVVSENGAASNDGRISIVTTSGARRSLIEGLPSGKDNQGDFSGPSDVVWAGRMLYVLIGAGDAEVAGATQGTNVLNPKGVSSPILSSLLSFRLSADVDDIQTPFRLEASQHMTLGDGGTVTLRNDEGQTAEAELVTDIRDMSPDPVSIWRASNPYSLVVAGNTAWIADASLDAILQVDLNGGGRTRVAKRFGKVPNIIPVGPPVTDTVPNHIAPWGDGLLVVEMTGFPFAAGNGRVEYMDPRTGTTQPFLNGLTMPIDIAWQDRQGTRPVFYTLEFSTAFLNQPPGPGRLMMYDTPEGRAIKSDLVTPTSMALTSAGEIYITELGTGRLLRVRMTQ